MTQRAISAGESDAGTGVSNPALAEGGVIRRHEGIQGVDDLSPSIHGWTDVPTYAASHGCVRVPYWVAQWIFGLDPVGTPVIIYT